MILLCGPFLGEKEDFRPNLHHVIRFGLSHTGMIHSCPFDDCNKVYGSHRSLRRHVLCKIKSPSDEKHSRDSQLYAHIVYKQKQSPEERKWRKSIRDRCRYEERLRELYPLQSELEDFKMDWGNEAARLNTPHHEKGTFILNKLTQRKAKYTQMEKFRDPLFENTPSIEHLVADLRHAHEQGTLQLIDSRSGKPDGISEHSAQNLLDCIESVEKKTFDSGSQSIHYGMVEMDWSPGGLNACGPKVPPTNLLTKSGSEPICTLSPYIGPNV